MQNRTLICLFLLSPFTAAGQDASQIKLRYLFTPGETMSYKTTTRAIQKGEYIRDVVSESEEVFSHYIQKVYDDSSADIVMTVEKTVVRVLGERISSERDDLVDEPILLRRKASGKILDVRPVNDVSSKVARLIERMKTNLEIERGFPDRAVSIGESWEDEVASSFDWGEMRVEQVLKQIWKLSGFEQFRNTRCAVVTIRLEVSGTVTTLFEEVPVKGTGRGAFFFDIAKGRVLQDWLEFQTTAKIESKKGPMNVQTSYGQRTEFVQP